MSNVVSCKICALLMFLIYSPVIFNAAGVRPLIIIYPRTEARPISDFGYKVLNLAMMKSGRPYRIILSEQYMNENRARAELAKGNISIIDQGFDSYLENNYEPVYFPIDLGLSGYRSIIVRNKNSAAFEHLRSLDELRKMSAGQAVGWVDNNILRANGVRVIESEFEHLFSMLHRERFDYLPLGVGEANTFLVRYHDVMPDAKIVDGVLLHYPLSRLFFCRQGDYELRDALFDGLVSAYNDGSLNALINEVIRFNGLEDFNLFISGVTLIQLDNPYLSVRYNAIPKKYFIRDN